MSKPETMSDTIIRELQEQEDRNFFESIKSSILDASVPEEAPTIKDLSAAIPSTVDVSYMEGDKEPPLIDLENKIINSIKKEKNILNSFSKSVEKFALQRKSKENISINPPEAAQPTPMDGRFLQEQNIRDSLYRLGINDYISNKLYKYGNVEIAALEDLLLNSQKYDLNTADISNIVEDYVALFDSTYYIPRLVINALIPCSIFLKSPSRDLILSWNQQDYEKLKSLTSDFVRNMHDFSYDRTQKHNEIVSLIDSINAEKQEKNVVNTIIFPRETIPADTVDRYIDLDSTKKVISRPYPHHKSDVKRKIKNLVESMAKRGFISILSDAKDKQFNDCLWWTEEEINNLSKEIDNLGTVNQKYDYHTIHSVILFANKYAVKETEAPPASNPIWEKFGKKEIVELVEKTEKYTGETFTTDQTVDGETSVFKKELKQAGIRVAAVQSVKLTQGILYAAVPDNKIDALKDFLLSDIGTAMVSMANSAAVGYAFKNNELAQDLSKEFRVSAMTTVGNFAVEELMTMITSIVKTSIIEAENSIPVIEVSEAPSSIEEHMSDADIMERSADLKEGWQI